MIIDYKADSRSALKFHPVDLATGKPIDFPIMYADDIQGVIRYYERCGPNTFKADPATGKPILIEERRAIRIVPVGEVP